MEDHRTMEEPENRKRTEWVTTAETAQWAPVRYEALTQAGELLCLPDTFGATPRVCPTDQGQNSDSERSSGNKWEISRLGLHYSLLGVAYFPLNPRVFYTFSQCKTNLVDTGTLRWNSSATYVQGKWWNKNYAYKKINPNFTVYWLKFVLRIREVPALVSVWRKNILVEVLSAHKTSRKMQE